MAKNKRQYDNDYPSVTGVLEVLRKIGLEMWFKYNTPEFIKEESEKGKTIGTQIHEVIHAYIQGETASTITDYPDEVHNALKSFMQFREENPLTKLTNSEIAMTSETYKLNGTLDCIGEDNGLIILDWKTGKCKDEEKPKIYEEYLYQVSAYVKIYNEVFNSDVKQALILSLAKDKVAFNTYRMGHEEIDEHFKNAFLPALKIWNHQHRGKK